ncbi:MAG TPA: DsbA family protein [Pseudomonadales bacterium]|jgi:2-hydroxychromene-2-carboxylate isomerase
MKLKTRLRSAAMRQLSSAAYLEKQRAKARKLRQRKGEPPVVHYFHQVDDPYSHLAVQKLDELDDRYDLAFQPHLASKPGEDYRGSAAHFDHWARKDAASVAADYGTRFAPAINAPAGDAVDAANRVLSAHLDRDDFARAAVSIGEALWSDQRIAEPADAHDGLRAVAEGNDLRRALGHYQGAMFYFEGEWFWGVDRIRLLERRLIDEGFGSSETLCVPEPTPTETSGLDTSSVLLEYFPSLRSPYTAIGHARVLDLIARSGVCVRVRPVMPMMMRGIPAPRAKQRYIITDAGREGRAHGAPFGPIVDPFGDPVKRAFALLPGAAAAGREMEYVTAYLNAAWFEGVDITTQKGLRAVATNAGMDWAALEQASRQENWEAILEENLNTMLKEDLWGVPSFRVSGGNSDEAFACWGQDRIWRVENEIASRT